MWVLEPNRFFGLYGYTDLRGRWLDPDQPRPAAYMEAIWGFLLNELPGGRTRLVVSGYQTFRPRWIERFAAEWVLILVSWIMQARMMAVLKRNIERAAVAQPHTVTGPRIRLPEPDRANFKRRLPVYVDLAADQDTNAADRGCTVTGDVPCWNGASWRR